MTTINGSHLLRGRSHRRLASQLSVALGLASVEAVAGTVYVTRCNDQDGIQYFGNSLRLAINLAIDGDVVDASGLSCSTITLERGELYVNKNLLLAGPKDHTLTVDAHGASRVIHQYGNYPLEIDYLTLANGASSGNGGCILSDGLVRLEHATLSGCSGQYGGGVFAPQVRIKYSTLAENFATNGAGAYASSYALLRSSLISGGTAQIGGGISVKGILKAYTSTIADNSASLRAGGIYLPYVQGVAHQIVGSTVSGNTTNGAGGGIYASTSSPYFLEPHTNLVQLDRSIVSNNHAGTSAGGVSAKTDAHQATISGNTSSGVAGGIRGAYVRAEQTTISGNSSELGTGGLQAEYLRLYNVTISGNRGAVVGGVSSQPGNSSVIHNSTIAFNAATGAQGTGGAYCDYCLIASSILANNQRGNPEVASDLRALHQPLDANNLIVSSNWFAPSPDPKLTPLGNHGGRVETHAILPTSPAFNTGINPDALENDARGSGFLRSVGGPDIGAYERQVNDDELFYGGFD